MLTSPSFSKYAVLVTAFAALSVAGIGQISAHEGSKHDIDVEVAPPALTAEGKVIVKTLERFAAAIESKDLKKIEKYVVADDRFTSLEDDLVLDRGWKNYSKHLMDQLMGLKDTKYSVSNVQPVVVGDLAYATMDWKMKFTIVSDQFEGGEHRLTMKGKGTVVMQKIDNQWKIRHRQTDRIPAPPRS